MLLDGGPLHLHVAVLLGDDRLREGTGEWLSIPPRSQPQQGERQRSLSPPSKPLYLEAEEQLGQCLDPLDKLWRGGKRHACTLPEALSGVHASPRGEGQAPNLPPTPGRWADGGPARHPEPLPVEISIKAEFLKASPTQVRPDTPLARGRPCLVI